MRSPVYRNLDKPFQIFGFSPLELMVLCVTFVGGGELATDLHFDRAWAIGFTVVTALALYWFRKSLGGHFAARLIRFSSLPSRLPARLFSLRSLR